MSERRGHFIVWYGILLCVKKMYNGASALLSSLHFLWIFIQCSSEKRRAEAPWRPILWRWKRRPSSCYTLTQCGLNHQGTSKWVSWQNGHLTAHLPVWSTGKWYLILRKPNRQIIAQWTCPNWTFLRTILPYWIKGPNRIGCQQTQPIRTPYGMNKLSQDSLKLVRRYFFLLLYFHECVES